MTTEGPRFGSAEAAPKNALTRLLDGRKTILGALLLAVGVFFTTTHFLPPETGKAVSSLCLSLGIAFFGAGFGVKMDKARAAVNDLVSVYQDLADTQREQVASSQMALLAGMPEADASGRVPLLEAGPGPMGSTGVPVSGLGLDFGALLGKLLPALLSGQLDASRWKTTPKGEEIAIRGAVPHLKVMGRKVRLGFIIQFEDDPGH